MKWCTGGVRDLWDFSAVGQVRAFACFQKSHWNGMETRWKDMKSGTGDGVLTQVKLEKNSNTSIKQHLVLAKIHLDFDSWSWLQNFWFWTWLYVSVADRLVSCQIWHGLVLFDIVFVHRPLPTHWKSTIRLRTSTCQSIKLARKEPRPGAWHGGLWLQASKRWNKMESRAVPLPANCQHEVPPASDNLSTCSNHQPN